MSNLNETEKFDSLFNKAGSDFELPFNEAAWKAMQQKLDKEQTKKKGLGLWWFLPVVVIAIAAGFYTFEKSKSSSAVATNTRETFNATVNSNVKESEENKKKIETISIIKNDNLIDDKINNKLKNNNLDLNKNIIRKELSYKQSIIANKTNQNKKAQTVALKTINKNDNNSSNADVVVSSIPNNTSNLPNAKPIIANNKTTNSDLKTIESIAEVKNGTKYYTATNLLLHNHYIIDAKKTAFETELAIATLEKKIKDEQDAERTRIQNADHPFLTERRNVPLTDWYVTAAIANNIGYVSNPRIDASSLQYHIGVGYNISKYLSVETGLTVGNRNFFAKKDQYRYQVPPYAIKYFQGVNANISVVDIPLNFKFQFSDRENHGFYGIAGISTLFLPKENYSLKVVHNNTYYIEQDFTNSQTILGLLNLSIGYQFPVNKNFIITTEPYLQLPFKNIGDGGTKLCSVGFQVGGRYNFDRKKKK